MTRRHWTITTHHTGRPRDVEVYLYDKLAHMRGAATRHSREWDDGTDSYSNAAGVCHGFQRIRVNTDGTEVEHPQAAILRFTRGHTSPEIVAHEVTHAAQHLYGLDCITDRDTARDHYDAANETFAYLTGDLFAHVWEALTT